MSAAGVADDADDRGEDRAEEDDGLLRAAPVAGFRSWRKRRLLWLGALCVLLLLGWRLAPALAADRPPAPAPTPRPTPKPTPPMTTPMTTPMAPITPQLTPAPLTPTTVIDDIEPPSAGTGSGSDANDSEDGGEGGSEGEYAPGGLLCETSAFGQLQNQVNSLEAMLLLALHLNRTAVMPPQVARVYRWLPLAKYRSKLLVKGQYRCADAQPAHAFERQCVDGGKACDLSRPRAVAALRRATAATPVLGLAGKAFFYSRRRWAASAPGFSHFFFANLRPFAGLRRAADAFVQRAFGATPFVAVHLRWLDGFCLDRVRRYPGAAPGTAALCSPPRNLTARIMRGVLAPADRAWPIFVASDRQRPEVLQTYLQAGDASLAAAATTSISAGADVPGFAHFNPLQAAVLDFEIAARASFFVGVVTSSASKNVASLRRFRRRPGDYKYHGGSEDRGSEDGGVAPDAGVAGDAGDAGDARRHWYPSFLNWTLPFLPVAP